MERGFDNSYQPEILSPEEVAQYLRKSLSWVYKHWQELGARKLGGSLFFPGKENLYEHIFSQTERLEIRLHPRRETIHGSMVQNEVGSKESGTEKKGDLKRTSNTDSDPNRHGLLGPNK